MSPDHTPILRAMAEQDPTCTQFHVIPVEFDTPVTCRTLTDAEAAVVARLFKNWSDKT